MLTQFLYHPAPQVCTFFIFALGIGPGDEVIVPAQTHVATVHAVELVGATPVFVDCSIEDGNVEYLEIGKHINNRTKAVSVVHFSVIRRAWTKLLKSAMQTAFT